MVGDAATQGARDDRLDPPRAQLRRMAQVLRRRRQPRVNQVQIMPQQGEPRALAVGPSGRPTAVRGPGKVAEGFLRRTIAQE